MTSRWSRNIRRSHDSNHPLSSGDGDSEYCSGVEDMDEALEVLRAEDTADSVMMDLAKRAGLTFKFFSFQYLSLIHI